MWVTLPLWSCTAWKTGRLMLLTVDSSVPATPASGDGTSSERPVLYTDAARPRPCDMHSESELHTAAVHI